jgi:hypothetical protein
MSLKNTIKNWKRFFRFYWQRHTRGWDDSVTCNLDIELIEWLLPRLKRFKELNNGHPGNLSWKKWNNILDNIIYGLEAALSEWDGKCDIEKAVQLETSINNAFKLLAKWHGHLWW